MSCSHCEAAVSLADRELDGVESVAVDLDAKRVVVGGPASRDEAVRASIQRAGYDVVAEA